MAGTGPASPGLEGIPSVLPIGKYKTTALRLLEGKTGVTKGSNFWELQGEHPNLQKNKKVLSHVIVLLG